MKKTGIVGVVLCLVLIVTSCTPQPIEGRETEYTRTEQLIGTFFSVRVYGENAKTATDKAFARAHALEDIFSLTVENSELNGVNQHAAKAPVAVSEELFYVLSRAQAVSAMTDNALAVSAGKLIDLWGIGTDHAKVPKKEEIEPLTQTDTVKDIVLNEKEKTVFFTNEKVKVNLGAVAKGYFADEMKRVFLELGIKSGLINLGGNVMTIGGKTKDTGWKVAITDPENPAEQIATVTVNDYSVVTSGNYEKYFVENGVTYHHILNAKTGYPSSSGLISSTIIAKNSTDCDALSTATFVLGIEKATALIEGLEDTEAVFVKEDGTVVTTSGIKQHSFKEIK